MTSQTRKARHRAACRPATVFTPLAQQAAKSGRATLAVVASGGLALSLSSVPAFAAPADVQPVDFSALTRDARRALATNPTVTVAPDAAFSLDDAVVEAAAAPVVEAPVEEAASRDSEREEVQAEEAPEEAPEVAEEVAQETTYQAPAVNAAAGSIVEIAQRYLGVPYVWGGSDPNGFDCSGFVQYVYAQAGIGLPRTSYGQGSAGTIVSYAEAQPGDIVAWGGHVAIYLGDGMIIHAPDFGRSVEIASIYGSPWFVRVG
ncbi:C40 family peptidase [Buchananella felis]|uniref:C40 family peptidase n=1 Tax=Buchananella felis TaxID=3231492 RepID=UPI003528F37F